MILQNIILSVDSSDTRLLYSTQLNGQFPLILKSGSCIDFFGYYNYFFSSLWKKYTGIDNFWLMVNANGKFKIDIFEIGKENKCLLYSEVVDCDSPKKIMLPPSNCVLGLQITTYSRCILNHIAIGSDIKPKKYSKIALNLCTYNREKYVDLKVQTYLESLKIDKLYSNSVELYIIDNSSKIKIDKYDCSSVHVFHNINNGGSGGFSRGIMEISKNPAVTHIVFMDDDTYLEPETLYRTWVLSSLLLPKYTDSIIGGLMISVDNPTIVVESSSYYKSGIIFPNDRYVDISSINGCIDVMHEKKANYNGWWYCVYPVTFANAKNLPMNFFLKMDDVEYGYRYNAPIIFLNGISVWHLDFYKKYSSTSYYYTVRNTLTILKKNNDTYIPYIKKLFRQIISEILCLRYKNVKLMLLAIDDFKKGYDWISLQNYNLHSDLVSMSYIFSRYNLDKSHIEKKLSDVSKFKQLITLNGLHKRNKVELPVDTIKSKDLYGVKHVRYIQGEYCFEETRDVKKAICLLFNATISILSLYNFRN